MIRKLYWQLVHWQEMEQHVSREYPLEACGLLAGLENKVEKVLPVHNAAKSPAKFRMEPQEQYNSFKWIEVNGLDLVGIYHSHPDGHASVSSSDLAEAAYSVVNIVWFKVRDLWNAKGFWFEDGIVSEVSLHTFG